MNVAHLYNYGYKYIRPAAGQFNVNYRASEQFMWDDLAKSGLVPDDVKSVPCSMLDRNAAAAYFIPYYDLEGRLLNSGDAGLVGVMHRVRQQPIPNLSREDLKKFPKYTQPSRSQIGEMATIPYIPPSWWGKGGRRFLIEGEKKALSFGKRFGARVMAIAGCHNWHNPDPSVAGLHPWIVEAMRQPEVDQLIIVPDGDIMRREINRAYSGLKTYLERLGVQVGIVNFSALDPPKVDDWLVANPRATDIAAVDAWPLFDESELLENRAQLVEDYQLLHRTNQAGNVVDILPVEYNVKRLFERHPYYEGAFRMNLDTMKLAGEYNEATTVVDTTAELQNVFAMAKANRSVVRACIGAVAYSRGFSPIKDWLNGLRWDGVDRLDGWMIEWLGAEDTEYVREVGRKALIAAVARKLRPGCIVDFMTILKGPQGIGKSSAVRILFGQENVLEYTRGNAEGKDALMVMNSAWCVSDEELGMLTRSDRNKLKAFITIRKDTWRPPYAADVQERPRQFVLWGSTNEEEFLADDETGHRRYAVVDVSSVDFKGLAEARDQLWAEAHNDFLRENTDYSNVAGTSDQVQKYVYGDPLAETLEDALARYFTESKSGREARLDRGGVTYLAIRGPDVARLLSLDPGKMSGFDGHRIGVAMRKLGWLKVERMRLPWDSGTNTAWTKRV